MIVFTKSILVIKINDQVSLGIIRNLGYHGMKIYGLGSNKYDLGLFSRFLTKGFVYPKIGDNPGFIEFVLKIINDYNIDYVIGTNEKSMIALNKHRRAIEKTSKLLIPPEELLDLVLDKRKTYQIAEELDIPYPKTYIIKNIDELKKCKNLKFPVVIKPSSRHYKTDSDFEMDFKREYISDYESLYKVYKKFESSNFYPLIQEYCIGDEVGFPVIIHNGECVICSQYNIIRMWPVNGGTSVLRRTERVNPVLKEYAVKLLKAMNWEGIAELDFIFDNKEKKYKLLEINGRFWGALPLSIDSGVDYPYLMVQCAEEKSTFSNINRKIGLKGRLLFGDIGWLSNILNDVNVDGTMYHLPSKTQAIKEFIKAFHPSIKYDIFTLKDPMPGIIKIAKSFKIIRSGVTDSFQIRPKEDL